jgi:hypothetical protein
LSTNMWRKFNLELSVINQLELDNKYNDLVTIIHDEMNSKLAQRKVVHKDGLNNKRRKMKKPWWNDNLTALWNEVCKALHHHNSKDFHKQLSMCLK